MIQLQERLLTDLYQPISKLQELLGELHDKPESSHQALLRSIEVIESAAEPGADDGTPVLALTDEMSKLTELGSDQERLKRACDELRFKLVLAAMTTEPVRQSIAGQGELDKLYSLEPEESGIAKTPIYHNRGGVISARVAQFYTVVLLPRIADEDHEEEVSKGLLEVYDRMGSQHSWVVDFSLVSLVPFGLLGNIIGYRHLLFARSGDLYICWLKDNALKASVAERVRGLLPLKKIGEYWFSTGK